MRWLAGEPVEEWEQADDPRVAASLAGANVLAFAAASWVQVGYWRNDVTLYEHALAVTDDNYVAHTNLGTSRCCRTQAFCSR